MNTTILLAIVAVFGGSILLAIPFMLLNKKRKGNEKQFAERNKDKAILHLYSSKNLIDGADIAYINPIKGQSGQKIVAIAPGKHTFEGVFETTTDMGKVNLKSKKLNFDLTLEAGHNYTLAVYLYSPEERKNYYKGDVGVDIFTLPLDIEGKGESSKAYIICYQED